MKRVLGVAVLLIAMSGFAPAQFKGNAPEIDPGSVANGLALLAGATLIVRGRRSN